MEFVLLIGRIIFGGFFTYNGVNHFLQRKGLSEYAKSKHIPSPEMAVSLSGAVLIASGISIMLGIFFNMALLGIIVFLFITSMTMHAFWNDTDTASKSSNQIHFLKNMALLGASLMLFNFETWPFGF